MDNQSYGIQWIQQYDGIKTGKQRLGTHSAESRRTASTTALLVSTGDEENEMLERERAYLISMHEHVVVDDEDDCVITESNVEQIAAENLIFMARDGQIEADLIAANTDAHGALVVAASDGNSILMQPEHNQTFIEVYDETAPQLVTEEVITDDWVQSQGEDRVEVSAEEIIGSGARLLLDIEVPLPTVQDEYTAQRPYPCDFCSRRFRKKTSLMNHMVAHKNDRPHICQLCDCRFFRRSDLINHLKRHPDPVTDKADYVEIVEEHELPQAENQQTANDAVQFYEQDWSTLATSRKNNKTETKVSNSSSSQSSNSFPMPIRGRTSRLKLPKDSYVLEETQQSLVAEQAQPMQLQADTSFEQQQNDNQPSTQVCFPIIDEGKPFVCQTCGRAFAREKALKAHMKNHNNDVAHECNQCNEIFWDAASLQDHYKTHQFDESSSEYEPAEADETQSDSDSGQKLFGDYYCSECGMSFHRPDLLRRHLKTHQKSRDTKNAALTDKQSLHCCNTCGETFDVALDLLAHADVHVHYPSFSCVLCGESFFEEQTIKQHLQKQHSHEMTANSCILCGKACRDSKALMKHAWDHSREKSYSCTICGKNFHNRARLNRHMTSHRDKSVVCDVCNEEFPDGRSLSNHRHSHSNNASAGKLFPCEQCGKTFGSRSSQQIHVRIHTGERPYGCRYCWKAFADGGTLRKHERIHTGEKPYACSVCPRAFNQRVVLREHIRSHHSGIDSKRGTYHCPVCDDDLKSSTDLIQHLIQHSDTNTAMKRQPITGPRKYKRRRKLKPHELERLRTESNPNLNDSDIGMSDIDIGTVDELLDITSSNTNATSSRSSGRESTKRNHSKTTKRKSINSITTIVDSDTDVNTEDAEEKEQPRTLPKTSNSNQSEKTESYKSLMSNLQNHLQGIDSLVDEIKSAKGQRNQSSKQAECTAQRTQQVQLVKSQTTAVKYRKKQEKSLQLQQQRPRMIHTEKISSTYSGANGKRRSKPQITRTQQTNLDILTKSSSSSSNMIDDYEIVSPAMQPPKQISQSPLHVKQEQTNEQSILYDAQLLLEASALRSKDYERFNPNIVNDLEEILRSPIKTDRCRFTSESSDKFMADQPDVAKHFIKIESTSPDLHELVDVTGSSDERRSNRNRQSIVSRRLIGFDMEIAPVTNSNNSKNEDRKRQYSSNVSKSKSGKNMRQETQTTGATSNGSDHSTAQLNFSIATSAYENIVSATAVEPPTTPTATTTAPARKLRFFECEMCSEIFTDRAQLLDHVPIHI